MSHRSPKAAAKNIIRVEAEKYTGRKMTNGQAKKWLKKQPKNQPLRAIGRTFSWPKVATLPTLFGGMAAVRRTSEDAPFGWGHLAQPGLTEVIQMPIWFWWGLNAFQWTLSAPMRLVLWIAGVRRKK
jgi:hypothetical protein